MTKKIINLDMDGTWVDLYGVENWLDDLINSRVRPYLEARPLVNLSLLARVLNELQRNGWEINVISWTSKGGTPEYDEAVRIAKMTWFKRHIPSVKWNNVYIVKHGTPKESLSSGYLFDDEEKNRIAWGEGAMSEKNLIENLKGLMKA